MTVLERHVLPAVNALAVYVDDLMTSVPGQAFTRGREGWWDPDLGPIVIREGNTFPSYEIYQDLNGSRTPVERIPATGHGALFDGAAGPVCKAADGVTDAVVDTGRTVGRAAGA